MPTMDLLDWIDEYADSHAAWFLKRLSANDTQATGGHQAGPYIPKSLTFSVFPSVGRTDTANPEKLFSLYIDSHSDSRVARVVWYNQGTRDETRITRLGGVQSALLDPESTGALAVFAFPEGQGSENSECHVWICDHETEADLVEERTGHVEPGDWRVWIPGQVVQQRLPLLDVSVTCWLDPEEIPGQWLQEFPSGADLVRKTVELRPLSGLSVDRRLLGRRECEFQVFSSVEEAITLPLIGNGFGTIADFVALAQTVLQRRRSRAGRSLELHVKELFVEEQLREGKHFQHQPESEFKKRPDFLFPNEQHYKDSAYPAGRLMMLAVKTTARDRWRQIVTEADRVKTKHLLTVQRGVSENQFREMIGAGVKLVVPAPLVREYPRPVQPHLQTLESFIADVRLLNMG